MHNKSLMKIVYTLIYIDYEGESVIYLYRRRSNFASKRKQIVSKICRSRIVIVYKRNHWYIVVFVPSPCFERRIDHILALFPSTSSTTINQKNK
jgi:hypothetical protein